MTFDLFADLPAQPSREPITEGAVLLRAFAAAQARELLQAIELVIAQSPLRHMQTPGGFRMSVAMSNCGQYGWVTDRRGYRYQHEDPLSGQAWPAMPPAFAQLAASAAQEAGFADFAPDACLVNRYEPGARMSLHQDKNELDMAQPIVSLSLGLPATFLFGGMERSERPRRMRLDSGDVVVWGGPARLLFHGVDPLAEGEHPLTGRCRYNLTFRRAR
ncbi:DNA oxidative demethylase AlkB [Herbaspirillum sp. SJZ099]|uniref:DNA oxidative demethylase AlkB n=1 Tax=Herbaspirillum sp. SJZ099 TaxID=2572916 RepID=UPI0011A87FA6|nr:DNA oxidative demethylase AlkB [Herbaspirillum sp. SJZ099]TWC71486.1 alkylated DNA repair protein (DNA oxidative demethylase) [Herbaspirillum sp. SJZ099]